MQALQGSSQRQSVQQLQRQYPRPLLQWCGARSRNCKLRCKCARQDLYAVLGVAYDADASAIKAAFRARAKKQHPDVNKAADAEAAFRLLKRAHEVLSDSMLRAAYDADLQDQLPEAAAALRARDPRFARCGAGWWSKHMVAGGTAMSVCQQSHPSSHHPMPTPSHGCCLICKISCHNREGGAAGPWFAARVDRVPMCCTSADVNAEFYKHGGLKYSAVRRATTSQARPPAGGLGR